MIIQKQKVHDALVWLINDDPQYSKVLVNEDALNILPEFGVSELMTVETDDDIVLDNACSINVGPPTGNPSEDIV